MTSPNYQHALGLERMLSTRRRQAMAVGLILGGFLPRCSESPADRPGADAASSPSTGSEGGACYGNGTCDDGLACLSDLCVRLSDAALPDATVGDAAPPDADPLGDCTPDELEANDSLDDAVNTQIPQTMDEFFVADLSICFADDEDFFEFQVDIAGKNLRADLTHEPSDSTLLLSVLNSMGTVIREGESVPGMPAIIRADVANMPQGTYYVQVRGAGDAENGYDLTIAVSGG